MQRLEDLQRLVLDMLSTERVPDPELMARLVEADWDAIGSMIRAHRLGPMLHWRLTHERQDVPIPAVLRSDVADAFKRSALRSLALQREIINAYSILESNGIPSIALKGAYLAYYAYPHPALRPLRDIDILVPMDKGIAAFETLLQAGYRQLTPFYGGNAEACLMSAKHLPPLRSSHSGFNIEVHVRLPGFPEAMNFEAAENGHWRRALNLPLGGRRIRYQSLTDLLYLMITHAVYEHRLDNGPLVLSDIHYLATAGDIDWPGFWRLAEDAGTLRGCVLLLRLAERYWGAMSVGYPEMCSSESEVVDMLIDACPALLLRTASDMNVMFLAGGLAGKTFSQKLAVLWDGIAASKHRGSDTSAWSIGRDLLRRIWHLGIKYLPALWASWRRSGMSNEVRKISQLNRWLGR